jgi:hypothetical protein
LRRIAAAEEVAWQQLDEANKRQRSNDQAKTDQPDNDDPASPPFLTTMSWSPVSTNLS